MCVHGLLAYWLLGNFHKNDNFKEFLRMIHMDKMKGVHGIVRVYFRETKQNIKFCENLVTQKFSGIL